MRILYCSKRGLRLFAAYVLTLTLLVGGASLFLPASGQEAQSVTAEAPAAPEAFRAGSADSPQISLAINVDWGEEFLPAFLAVLEENDVSATFFLTGRWCANNAELAKAIAEAGHELGNHGYSHASPNASSIEEIVEEISRTEEAIRQATGAETKLYAPPSGEEEEHVRQAAAQAGYHTVLWSVDTIDWQQPDAATIIQRVESKIHNGAIILAHPTAGTAEALPTLISDLQAEGYIFVPVSQNLGL